MELEEVEGGLRSSEIRYIVYSPVASKHTSQSAHTKLSPQDLVKR